ncbi:hypothetical protein GUG22_07410, partial [Xanthomonas citri pv. citri]|nr:hypothetical protein [Xanthomonas citri pv. citri]
IEISGIEEKINNLVNPKIKTNCEREGFSSISCDYSPNPNAFQNIEIVGFDLTEESKNKLKNYERP